MRELFSDYILSADQLKAIGNVAVETTYLEIYVENVIWRLAGMQEASGKFFTDQMRVAARLELLANLAKPRLTSETKLATFTELISNLKIECEKRNIIIHGEWTIAHISLAEILRTDRHRDAKPAFAKKRRLKMAPLEFSATDVRKTSERIYDLTMDLAFFCENEWPPT